jgi:hypothetical protein
VILNSVVGSGYLRCTKTDRHSSGKDESVAASEGLYERLGCVSDNLTKKHTIVDIILTPETATAEKRNVVIPPRTALGMATSAAANFEKIPMTISQKQQA